MTKPVKLDSTAEREAAEAYAYYEAREAGLGKRFFQHLARTLEQVGRFPEASQPMPGDHAASVRAARTRGSNGSVPYRVVFVIPATRSTRPSRRTPVPGQPAVNSSSAVGARRQDCQTWVNSGARATGAGTWGVAIAWQRLATAR